VTTDHHTLSLTAKGSKLERVVTYRTRTSETRRQVALTHQLMQLPEMENVIYVLLYPHAIFYNGFL